MHKWNITQNNESIPNLFIMSFFEFLILKYLYIWLILRLNRILERILNHIRRWLKISFFTTFDMMNPITLQMSKILLNNFRLWHFFHLFHLDSHISLLLSNPTLILNFILCHRKLSFLYILMLIGKKLKLI